MHRAAMVAAVCSLMFAVGSAIAAPPDAKVNTKPIQIRRSYSIQLPNACRYNADIRGEVVPVRARPDLPDTVAPNLIINSDLQCSDGATLRLPERIQSAEPVTLWELEQMIEERTTLATSDIGPPCTIAPDFELSAAKLNLYTVSITCPPGAAA